MRYPAAEAVYQDRVRAFFGGSADKVLAEYPTSDYTDPSYALAAVLTDSGFQGGLGGCFALGVANLFAAAGTTYFYELYDPNAPTLAVARRPQVSSWGPNTAQTSPTSSRTASASRPRR